MWARRPSTPWSCSEWPITWSSTTGISPEPRGKRGTPRTARRSCAALKSWRRTTGERFAVATSWFSPSARHRRASRGSTNETAGLIRQAVARRDEVAPNAVVVIVTNPVDVMARIAQEASVRPWHMIFGTGTVLDTARLRLALATKLGVHVRNADVRDIGEHGDGSFPACSSATIVPVPLSSFPLPRVRRRVGRSNLGSSNRQRAVWRRENGGRARGAG